MNSWEHLRSYRGFYVTPVLYYNLMFRVWVGGWGATVQIFPELLVLSQKGF